jgi:two-component system phosphate regulon sensor histidine kinase PhoR
MPKNALENNYIKFVLSLTAAVRKLGLYPSKHPAVVYAIKDLYSTLQEILNIKDTINISLSSDNQILIEDYLASEKGSKLIEGLVAYFKKLDIESLTISSGISNKELEGFIRIILMESEEIKRLGSLNKVFLDRDIQHIKVGLFSYVKVQKGKVLLEVGGEKQQPLDRLKSRIKDYSAGKIQKPEDIQSLERDIIDAVITEFKEKKRLPFSTKNMLKKFLLESKDRNGVLLRLNNALLNSGCLPKGVNKLVNKIGEETSKKLTKKPEIKAKEIERLKGENEGLKSKIGQLQKEIDSEITNSEELKKENKRVIQERERIDNIIRYMAEGLVVVDAKGKIVMLNPVAQRLLGIKKDAIGVPLSKTVKDEHLLSLVKNIMPDKEGGIQKDVELLSPDESTRKVLRTSSAVVEDYNGRTVGMVTILNDITRQKEIEKMKTDFVANVSHELRTPLSTIQQNIALLIEGLPGALNETQMKFLSITQNNIKRLKRLISDLLDSAAIEAGKFKLKISKVDINEIINNVVTFLSRWAKTKDISMQTDLPPGSEVLEMDKDRIEQVLTNLISNAVKFTPEGGKILISSIVREPTEQIPQGAIEISVRDSGPGIAPGDIERIFEKFERAGAVSPGVGGTGLGLSICKEILRMHGGRIWVESKLTEGSEFSFLLPRKLT